MPFTDYTDQKIVQWIFGRVAYTPPADLYVAVSITDPSQVKGSGTPWTFTEPSTTDGYGRVELANSTAVWVAVTSEPTDGFSVTNAVEAAFGAPSGAWGNVKAVGVFDSPTVGAGNLIAYVLLASAKTVPAGATPPSIAAKALVFTND